jgi:hypothetical protein
MKKSRYLCIAALLLVVACSGPSKRFDQQAWDYGFQKSEYQGNGFSHLVYHNNSVQNSLVLHVYLGGDGTPWIDGKLIAWDPTPRNPVGLRLMALDDLPSIYLGRPCYHGKSITHPCSPSLWTSERYSAEVVDSMAVVLQEVIRQGEYQELVLIGFSGGGGLAMLLAERFPQTRQVVTLAGNLDIQAWVTLHHYDALTGSLNPRNINPLADKIQQYHLAGGRDTNIPPQMIKNAIQQQKNSQFILLEGFTHGCCWEKIWKSMLECLSKACVWKERTSAL